MSAYSRAEEGWQITPRRPGAYPPEDGLQKQTIVLCRDTSIADLTWKMWLKPLPQHVRHHKTLFAHSNLHFGSLNQKSDKMGILNVHRP